MPNRTPVETSPSGCALEQRMTALAASQHGVVTRTQLLRLGMSKAAIGRRVKSERLRALHRGVYLVGPIEVERTRAMAALLAGGPEAVLSHTSALLLWKMLRSDVPSVIHITVPGTGRRGRPGIAVHRVGPLADDERAVVDGVGVTAPGRTIVDAAGLLGSREIELAVAVAEREGLVGRRELEDLPRRYAGRPGIAIVRALIQERPGPDLTRSEAERRCVELLRAGGLPRPHANVPVGPYELDLFWPDEGVAIEIDGWAHHSSRPRFEGDRRKDNWLRSRGIEVIRLTWRQITRDAVPTAVQVGQILALARAGRTRAADPAGPGLSAPAGGTADRADDRDPSWSGRHHASRRARGGSPARRTA